MNELLDLARHAAAEAADLLLSGFATDAKVASAKGKDVKTLADVAAQNCIIEVLRSSGFAVLAEESEHCAFDVHERVWLVDPLDGTLNFTRGFPMAAVSIALWEGGVPQLGVVHDIFSGQVYSGTVGGGAWLDGQPMCISDVIQREQAVLATGFPSGRNYETDSLLRFVQSVQKYKKVRMLGSAALMLAQVAAGRFEVYEEEDIYLWDVAAGLALVQAAGGRFEMKKGSGPYQYNVRASNGQI
jgi:myo-inositol-1(or 4)-monophosphatase